MSSVASSTPVESSNLFIHTDFKEIQDGYSWQDMNAMYDLLKQRHKFEDDFATWLSRYHGLNCFNTKHNVEDFNEKILNGTMGINCSFNQAGFKNIFEPTIQIARVELVRDRPRKHHQELQQRCLQQMKKAFESGAPEKFSIGKKQMEQLQKDTQSSNNVEKYGTCPICLAGIGPNDACILLRRRNMGKADATVQEKSMEQACKCTFCETCITRYNATQRDNLGANRFDYVNRNTEKLPDCPCCKNKYFAVLKFRGSVQPTDKCETLLVPDYIHPFLFTSSLADNSHNFDHLHRGGEIGEFFHNAYRLNQFFFEQERALTLRKNTLGKENFDREDTRETFHVTDYQREGARQVNPNLTDVGLALDDLRFAAHLYLDQQHSYRAFVQQADTRFRAMFRQFEDLQQDWLHCNPYPYGEYAREVFIVMTKLKAVYDAILTEERNYARSQMEPQLEPMLNDHRGWDGRTRAYSPFDDDAQPHFGLVRTRSNSFAPLDDEPPARRRRTNNM